MPPAPPSICLNQVLSTFFSLKARLAEEASLRREEESLQAGVGVGNDWSRTLNTWCGETSYVQYGGNPPPTFGPEMTINEYVEIPGVDDIMTKVSFSIFFIIALPLLY